MICDIIKSVNFIKSKNMQTLAEPTPRISPIAEGYRPLAEQLDFGVNEAPQPLGFAPEETVLWDQVQDRASELGVANTREFRIAHGLLLLMNDFHTPFTSHEMRVSMCAQEIAPHMGVDPGEALIVGLLHDIGKMAVPAEIAKKTGAYDDQDHEAMGRHSEYGFEMVAGLGLPDKWARVIGTHHMKQDHPRGMDIALEEGEQRLRDCITIADNFDSATTRDDGHSLRPADERVAQHTNSVLMRYYGDQTPAETTATLAELALVEAEIIARVESAPAHQGMDTPGAIATATLVRTQH